MYDYFRKLHYPDQPTWPVDRDCLGEWITLRATGAIGIRKVKAETIASNLSALRALHIDRGFDESVFDSPWIRRIISGIRRTEVIRQVKQAEPMSLDTLGKITRPANTIGRYFDDLNLDVALKVAFAGFLRMGEFTIKNSQADEDPDTFAYTRLTRRDITFAPDGSHAILRLKRSKADYEHRGVDVVLAATGTPTCPVAALIELFHRHSRNLDEPLFATSTGEPLRRNWVISHMRTRLLAVGVAIPSSYSGHSLRRGAAQHAADNGLTNEDIQDLGRWKSDSFKRYFKRSIRERLALNKRFQRRTDPNSILPYGNTT
jgi:hypothetical protein